jgi:uncharacterized protein (TIGR00255 family)
VQAEVRSVNNKHLKVSVSGELSADIQSQAEQIVRESVSRGSIYLRFQIERKSASGYRLNLAAIESYRKQLASLGPAGEAVPVASLLVLPGIAESGGVDDADPEILAAAVSDAVTQAMASLNSMRQREGDAMARNLTDNLDQFQRLYEAIDEQAPRVVELFSARLTERLNQLLEKHDVQVQPSDVIREIGIFAERTDIHEELVRLRSHLGQFRQALESDVSEGRKLDFMIQELLRETNTIGSKANDAAISTSVVEMKSVIERMREMVQNVE